jgi:hypothetical protein
MLPSGLIFAQVDLSTVEGQLSYLVERAASIEGVVFGTFAVVSAALIIPRARGFDIASFALLFIMSFPLHFATLLREQNTLVGPLQTLRSVSRPLSYVLLAVLVARALIIDRGHRFRPTTATAIAFLCFQLYYVIQLVFFDSMAKGALAVFSVSAMMVVFTSGFGREMQDRESTTRSLEVLAWFAVAFIGVNLVQLALGFGSAFAGGRFVGTSGNAQAMGLTTGLLLLGSAYLFADLPASRPLRWVCLASMFLLSGFLVASGSRGNALATVVGLLVAFRKDLGRLVGVGIVGVIGAAVLGLVFGDEALGSERLLSTDDTRTGVWMQALSVFQEYPLFGSLAVFGSDQPSNGVESSLIRALALMGIVGGALYLIPTAMMALDWLHSTRLSHTRPDLRRLCDFHAGLTAFLLLLNVYEGVSFGVLTLPVMYTYLSFAIGGFLREQALYPEEVADSPDADPAWATT